MSKFWAWLLLFFLFFAPAYLPANAQTSQNVVLSCLDATRREPVSDTIDGVAYHHLASLKNREANVFSPNQPVYIIRSLPKTFCDSRLNDPNCVKVEPENLQRCHQEKLGEDICNRDCPWTNGACVKNNHGPGTTICCTPNYQKPGPYFQCAKDKNLQVVCPSSILATDNQEGGIHTAENGDIKTGYISSFILASNTKESLLADSEGNIFIPAAQSQTLVGMQHSFYGLQVLSDEALMDTAAFRNSLKLALFAEVQEIHPSATNCTSVYWDPFGIIIDSLRLEPISGASLLLQNLNSFNQLVNTTVPNNPTFRNPDLTDEAGGYNFAVSPGTYFLSPTYAGFSFPVDEGIVNSTLSKLAAIDPNQEYVARDKIYNNSSEPIIETSGVSQRRDIIMTPTDPNYTGTTPIIMYAENLRDGSNQLVRGRVSHPRSIIKAYVGTSLIAQTQANWQGLFSLSVLSSTINNNIGNLQLIAEKIPLVSTSAKQPSTWFANWIAPVWAQTTNTSKPYSLAMVPLRLTGFVFDPKLRVKPNSIVKLRIPSLGNMAFAQTRSDDDGFINIAATNLPPFDFVLTVENPKNPAENYQFTVDDFKKTNVVYYESENANLYNDQRELAKPAPETVKQIAQSTSKRVNARTLSANLPTPRPTTTPNSSETQSSPSGAQLWLLLLLGAVLVIGGIIVLARKFRSSSVYY